MDTHNFVLAITTGLLAAPDSRLVHLFNYFHGGFDVTGIQSPERPSVIVQDCSAVRISLKKWVQDGRLAGATFAGLSLSPEDVCGEAYKMAGFAGGRPWTLAIANPVEAAQFLIGSAGASVALFQRPNAVKLNRPPTPDVARQEFEAVLAETQDFALRVGSGFAERFRLALLFCEKAAMADDAELDQGALRIEVAGHFPTDDQAWLDSRMSVVDSFAQFDWEARKLLGLAAVSAADVFVERGSWNDQSFDGTDQALFENLSARLYGAMNDYFAALLST